MKSTAFVLMSVLTSSLLFSTQTSAAPYQIEAEATFAQLDASFPNGSSVDGDSLGFSVTYYLQVVDTTTGPLSERAFLDKSAFVTGSFIQTEFDQNQDSDSLGVNVRLVTQDDMIFEIGYDKTDTGSNSDSKTLELGVGKYLDAKTTAVFFYESEDNGGDVDAFGGRYRRLVDGSTAGTSVAYRIRDWPTSIPAMILDSGWAWTVPITCQII